MKLTVLFGKPGSGKGSRIGEFLKGKGDEWETISTGEMIRQAIRNGTPLGKEVKKYTDSGNLVPDSIVVKIVKETLKSIKDGNVILDGFPRNVSQAEAMLKLDLIPEIVICLDATDNEIIERLSKRVVCEICSATFSLGNFKHPKVDGICDNCGGNLVRRKDDEPEVVKNRLKVYKKETEPIINFMKDNKIKVVRLKSDVSQDAFNSLLKNI